MSARPVTHDLECRVSRRYMNKPLLRNAKPRLALNLGLPALLALGVLAGCAAEPDAPESDALLGDDLLVPIPRELDGAAALQRGELLASLGVAGKARSAPPATFYLAV